MTTRLPTSGVSGWLSRSPRLSTARPHRDPLRDAYLLAAVALVLLLALGLVPWFGVDARSFWLARMPDPYPATYGGVIGFNYSPVVAQLLAPLTLLPWPVFLALVTAGNLVALWLLVGRWSVVALLFPPVAIELFAANINLWLAVVLVYALRWPALWAVPILTKVAPGVGVLWHLFRGEWRALAIAVGATAALVAVSALLAPETWLLWFAYLRDNAGLGPLTDSVAVPFLWRAPIAVAVMLIAARTDRAWLIPGATILATPIIWPATFVLLLATPKLRRRRVRPAVQVGVGRADLQRVDVDDHAAHLDGRPVHVEVAAAVDGAQRVPRQPEVVRDGPPLVVR